MPLTDTKRRASRPDGGENAETHDQNGVTVIVRPSQEAVQDHDWAVVIGVASDKHDAGQITTVGPPPIIDVTEEECRMWLNSNA
jgi:hypothetical protein